MSNALQVFVNGGRRVFPRGWSPFLRSMARVFPSLRQYPASLMNGARIYLDLREEMCHGVFFYGGQPHEYGTEKVFRKVLKPGDIVLDIGANVGYYTRIASRMVGGDGAVLAFEPMPAALRVLRMNCADLPNAEVFPMALSDREGESVFYVRKKGDMSSLAADSRAKTVRVKTGTVDDVLKNCPRLDFIKIDVEGFELEVIRGAHRTLAAHRPVVYFEFVQNFADERGFGFEDFEALLGRYDYVLKWVDHSMSETIVSAVPSNYIIAVPSDRQSILA